MTLLFNIAAAATLLPLSRGMLLALVASSAAVAEYIWRAFEGGDGARNIAELVIYLVRGTDVRHMGLKRMEQEVKGDEAQ